MQSKDIKVGVAYATNRHRHYDDDLNYMPDTRVVVVPIEPPKPGPDGGTVRVRFVGWTLPWDGVRPKWHPSEYPATGRVKVRDIKWEAGERSDAPPARRIRLTARHRYDRP